MLFGDECPAPSPVFYGRKKELDWLFDRVRHRGAPIVISGMAGVGKTTLLKQFLASVRSSSPSLAWTLRDHPDQAMIKLTGRIEELYGEQNPPEIVAIDEAETLSGRDMNVAADRLLNLKAIRTVIFATRQRPDISRAEVLDLGPLSTTEAEDGTTPSATDRALAFMARPRALLFSSITCTGGLPGPSST
jgi:predicted AAA+ superfamily ATPase